LRVGCIEGSEQGAIICGDDGVLVVLEAPAELFVDALEHVDVARTLVGVVVQRGAQGDGAGASEVGADFTEGNHGGHPGDTDFVRGGVHLPGFMDCDEAHGQDQCA